MEKKYSKLESILSICDGLLSEKNSMPKSDNKEQQRYFEASFKEFEDFIFETNLNIFDIGGQDEEKLIREASEDIIKEFRVYHKIYLDHHDILEKEGKVKSIPDSDRESHLENTEKISKVHPDEGKMHKILGVEPGEKIEDKFKSGEDLYKHLLSKLKDHTKVIKMIAYAANISKENDIFDAALRYAKEHRK